MTSLIPVFCSLPAAYPEKLETFKRLHLSLLTVCTSDQLKVLGCCSGRIQAGVLLCQAAGDGYYKVEMSTSMNNSIGGWEEMQEKPPFPADWWKMKADVWRSLPELVVLATSLGAAGAFPEVPFRQSVAEGGWQDLLRVLWQVGCEWEVPCALSSAQLSLVPHKTPSLVLCSCLLGSILDCPFCVLAFVVLWASCVWIPLHTQRLHPHLCWSVFCFGRWVVQAHSNSFELLRGFWKCLTTPVD